MVGSLFLDLPKNAECFGKVVLWAVAPAAFSPVPSFSILCSFLPPSEARPFLGCLTVICESPPDTYTQLCGPYRPNTCLKTWAELLCLGNSLFSPLPSFNLKMSPWELAADTRQVPSLGANGADMSGRPRRNSAQPEGASFPSFMSSCERV